MTECIPEDDLLELAQARRSLADLPALEAHLADCSACGALLRALFDRPPDQRAAGDLTGRTLGPYRIDGLIGSGGMGQVYRGWDLRLRRHVAVKVLTGRHVDAPEQARRMEAEARAAAAITHPNVVTVYDTGVDEGTPFIVGELVTGESLRSVIQRGPVPRPVAIGLALQLARGVAAAHAQGVVHRDLKPENLIVTVEGTLKILDFGLARLGREADGATDPAAMNGTAGYLAPEQARGEQGDARSDIFAIGALLHELLTGHRAFGGTTLADRLLAVLRETPAPIDDPVGPIVSRCLEKEPRLRFQSADDLAWALERAPASAPSIASPATPAAAATPGVSGVSRRTLLLGAAATGIGGLLLGRALAPERPSPRLDYRQLTYRPGRVTSARFTPDGGSVLYSAAWDELPLAIHTTRPGGGGTRPLDLPPAQLLAVSARGQLAIALDHHYVQGFHHQGQLALAPLEGGPPRLLGLDVQYADFTPYGDELAIVRPAAGRFRLEMPAGNVLLEAGWLSHPRVSPDGQRIACLVHDDPGDDRGDVVLVPRAGGAARTIAAGWTSIDGLAWGRGGRELWISASRQGGNNMVRTIDLNGRELLSVPSVGRLRMHDLDAGGLLAVTHSSGRMRMMVRAPGAREEADLSQSDVSLAVDLSADGRTLVFVELGDVDTANGVYVRSTAGGSAQRLGGGVPVSLADEGRGVLAVQGGRPPKLAVYPIAGGQPRSLEMPSLADLRSLRWCPGGRLLLDGAEAGRPARLWRFDGAPPLTPLTDEGIAGPAVVSADGHQAALIVDGRLLVIDLERPGPPRVVPGAFADEQVCGWYTGGAELLVRTRSSTPRVRRVDRQSGASTPLLQITPPKLGLRGVDALVVSQAGDAYAYSYGQELSRLYTMTPGDIAQ